MIFNSATFVLFFLAFYAVYVVLNHRSQNAWLLLGSYVFYGWWDWRFLFLIALSTIVDYTCALMMSGTASARRRRVWVTISVCTNLGILGFFKYFNFFADNFQRVLETVGFQADAVTLQIVLPVGISFYTFQTMSYTIDVYRGKVTATKNLLDLAVYVSLFPQLVAGPIERAETLLPQVQNKRHIRYEQVREGCWLILLGYFKKMVIADNLSGIADSVFNAPGEYHGLAVLLGIYAFAFQIYGDFSGYTDIARGVSKLMGFELMLNFRMPYFAHNPQEFWRRWHISLSTWLRDYLYIPLGGNRRGGLLTYRNLFLTMLLGGLWHGAAWNFVAWGAYQGGLLMVHRLFEAWRPAQKDSPWRRVAKIAVMFQFVCLGWVLFRVNTLADAPVILTNLFTRGPVHEQWIVEMVFLIAPLLALQLYKERRGDMAVVKQLAAPMRLAVYLMLFAYIVFVGNTNGQEFIYFQF